MSILGKFIKQPVERESYSVDYVEDLNVNDGLATAVVTVLPADLTILSHLIVGTRVKVLLEGGTVGVKYKVTVTVETDDGRILQDEFFVTIKDY